MPKKFCCALLQLTSLTLAELKRPPFTVKNQDLKKFMSFMKKSFALQKQKPKKKKPQISDEILLEIMKLIQERLRTIEEVEKLVRGEHDFQSQVTPQDTPKKWEQLLSKFAEEIAQPEDEVVPLVVAEKQPKIYNTSEKVLRMSGRTLDHLRIPDQIPNSSLFRIPPPPPEPEVIEVEGEEEEEEEESEEGESEEGESEEEEGEGEEDEGEEEEAEQAEAVA